MNDDTPIETSEADARPWRGEVPAAEPSATAVQPPADPMDWPLPCDVTVGHGTMRKGVRLGTLVTRMKVLYEMATGENADRVASRTPEERAELFAEFQRALAAVQPATAPVVPAGWREFVARVAAQKPEKPDYWSSCGQCVHNISDAEDLLAAAPAAPAICRADGRCQYAIDHGAEGLGHCPPGKCAMPAVPATQPLPACKGMNCGCTDGVSHSIECQAEHAAAVAGGVFVKAETEPAAQQGEAVANSSICQRCGKSAGATMPPPGWPRDHLCTCQPAAAPQPVAQEPLHIGACIVGGRLHATVMRREPSGAVTVIATAEMPAASLQNHDYIAEMAAAPAGAVGEPVAPEDWRDKIIADLRAAHDSAVAQIERLTTKIAAMAPQPQKPLDDPRLQELFSSAISGALALGAAGESHPPAGHWLEDWWQRGRDGAAAPQPGARQALSDVEIDAIGNGLNGHQQPISRRERDRLIARAVIRACAADWGVTLAGIGGKGETA